MFSIIKEDEIQNNGHIEIEANLLEYGKFLYMFDG